MVREVEIEIAAIPDQGKDGTDNRPLKKYIQDSVDRNHIATTTIFGFFEANPAPDFNQQNNLVRFTGFGQGTFQSDTERDWYSRVDIQGQIIGKSKRGSGLTKNEADASVGAASYHSLVLTCDSKMGPISIAAESGGKVCFLSAPLDSELLKQSLYCAVHS